MTPELTARLTPRRTGPALPRPLRRRRALRLTGLLALLVLVVAAVAGAAAPPAPSGPQLWLLGGLVVALAAACAVAFAATRTRRTPPKG
ncbi:hypothetical protein ACH4E8_06685 [Streptomyces sp. NPDC017979]|uniref:hypothetical protein n=1 Tax=Streptomyces sp. NPDC017979 TaxID=3365024 RepID=UPI00379FB2D8